MRVLLSLDGRRGRGLHCFRWDWEPNQAKRKGRCAGRDSSDAVGINPRLKAE